MKKFNTKQLVVMALMIAMEVVLTRLLSIQTPEIRFSLGFLPIAVTAMMFGPLSAGIVGALADFIGVSLFGTGTPFPGFVLSGFLIGATYGLLMYKRVGQMLYIVIAVLIVTVAIQLALDTLWVHMIIGTPYVVLLPMRAVRSLIMIPVQIILIKSIAHTLRSMKMIGA